MRFITPGSLRGEVQVPPSKSVAQRSILAATLADAPTTLVGLGRADDVRAALGWAGALGCGVEEGSHSTTLTPRRRQRADVVNCGESATLLRLGAAVAALGQSPVELHARGSLTKRPMTMLTDALAAFGARCRTCDGFAPVHIDGGLRAGTARVDASTSSQHISGLMLALAVCDGDSTIELDGAVSVDYLRLTAAVQATFGVTVDVAADASRIEVPGGQTYAGGEYDVDPDWSSAAFWVVAAALTGEIALPGMRLGSGQADEVIVDVVRRAGIDVDVDAEGVTIRQGQPQGFDVDATHCPDLVPIVTVLAMAAKGTSRIYGVERLRHKESDRLAVLIEEFGGMGAQLTTDGHVLTIDGAAGRLTGGSIHTHQDHRIAMAAAVVGAASGCGVTIDDDACVAKSYPDFFAHMEGLRP